MLHDSGAAAIQTSCSQLPWQTKFINYSNVFWWDQIFAGRYEEKSRLVFSVNTEFGTTLARLVSAVLLLSLIAI